MPTRAIKSISWLWIASLSLATVGVSVQQIYCYCVGKTTISLFSAEDACFAEQHGKTARCCTTTQAKPVSSCCEKKGQSPSSNGCTKKTTKVFQLKTEFTVQEKLMEKLPLPSIDLAIAFVPFPILQHFSRSQTVDFHQFAHPPPPLSGRMICVRHGVFRC